MRINKTLFTLGDVGDASELPKLMRKNECEWLYFVYKTEGGKHPLCIGTLNCVKQERGDTVVLGAASSRKLARELALHIVVKALSLDGEIERGLYKLITTGGSDVAVDTADS